MEGLDLTDDMMENQQYHNQNAQMMNNLSSINKDIREHSYFVSEGQHLQNLVNARAEFEDQEA